ncbi:hypothetical protein Pcac1_g12885 [Phytophthora cactorum]|uniref:Uncharacterized protein n=1 Tax=Phytophthora cactorum TaxID=29920 RepID=A0A329SAF2_9STRA|nr:hypothetical protein Pcac1_g12885 [Phytophthora cactorum]KAG2830670.1 hypothetical protein PC111_g7294 [Phytophthora cactorum]KAG2841104.1 hypothetical protein PC112_g3490 [Phytophthora cactorum]KAG2865395.1 hypothetical protein PC113_g3730 [Phytophthora cactorum]KAG2926140.1 hypothetical protein PC114_g3879 [Phytophthora cactorum]
MEQTEQDARSRQRRSAKGKDKATGRRKKSVVTPGDFKLHTELLAEKRTQQREEKEVAHLRHAQQKILGKKTVNDFAQLKLIRRESAATRSRSLHCNGKTLNLSRKSKECELIKPSYIIPERTVRLESRPLMSARLSRPALVADSLPQRPMSAKPVLQSQYRSSVGHTASLDSDEEAKLLDNAPPKTYLKKKRKKKSIDRKSGRLTSCKSTPVLSDKAEHSESLPVCKKINIVVHMRNLQLVEEQNTPSGASPPVISREAWGD